MGAVVNRGGIDPWKDFEIFKKYSFTHRKLGIGQTCQIHEATEYSSNNMFAVKVIVKKEAELLGNSEDLLHKEADIMRRCRHPNICAFHESFEDNDLLFFVLELCEGGTLFEKLEQDVVLEEQIAKKMCTGMLSAVAHCHDKGVIHRDLRPESWLLSDLSGEDELKLSNFRMAVDCTRDELLSTPCGTLHYVAPEVLRGQYGRKSDNWTLGVLLFLMVYGSYPFDGDSCSVVMTAILTAEPDWCNSCYNLSDDVRDLLKGLLVKSPEKRITLEQGLKHAWLPKGKHSRPSSRRTSLMDALGGIRTSMSFTKAMPFGQTYSGSRRSSRSSHRVSEIRTIAQAALVLQSDVPELKANTPGASRRASVLVTDELIKKTAEALSEQLKLTLANKEHMDPRTPCSKYSAESGAGSPRSPGSPKLTLGVLPVPQ